jgi:hypothetical protein
MPLSLLETVMLVRFLLPFLPALGVLVLVPYDPANPEPIAGGMYAATLIPAFIIGAIWAASSRRT